MSGIDLSRKLSDADFAAIFAALGRYGVLCFPDQQLDSAALRDFSQRFGGLQTSVTGKYQDPTVPEVGYLSNIIENGEPIGLADAGQDWHTDMSYNATVGFTNVLYAVKVPRRDGKPLGATQFANMHAAYDDLAAELKERLADATATHDFNKFWESMRQRPGSLRPALTEEQRRKRPPSVHPVFLTHPITGRKVLYCNPGYAIRINELRRSRERPRARDAVRAPASAEIHLHAHLERARRAHVGSHRHAAQCDPRLPARRAPADDALPGDGGPGFRSGFRAQRASGDLRFKYRAISREVVIPAHVTFNEIASSAYSPQ